MEDVGFLHAGKGDRFHAERPPVRNAPVEFQTHDLRGAGGVEHDAGQQLRSLSGWAPRYIPQQLIHEANTRLQDKVLFGSDFPYLPPDRWLSGFSQLEIREEVRPKILLENAKRVLGL